MKLKPFNAYADMRIDKIKAHSSYLKKKKVLHHTKSEEDYNDNKNFIPSELSQFKGLAAGAKKHNTSKEHLFDVNGDGKSIKVKKPSRAEKQSSHYIMMDGKKYHSISGTNKVEQIKF